MLQRFHKIERQDNAYQNVDKRSKIKEKEKVGINSKCMQSGHVRPLLLEA